MLFVSLGGFQFWFGFSVLVCLVCLVVGLSVKDNDDDDDDDDAAGRRREVWQRTSPGAIVVQSPEPRSPTVTKFSIHGRDENGSTGLRAKTERGVMTTEDRQQNQH